MRRPAAPAPALDPRIARLPCTTFCGQRLTRRQIGAIQETVSLLPQLSRTELGHTICEHLGWQTPRGTHRIQLAMRVLGQLERLGILTLPARQGPGRGRQQPLIPGPRSAPQAPVEGPLDRLLPLRLRLVRERTQAALWNEFVERYHPLGYRQPIGCHLRYFLADRDGRRLGCLLYDFAAQRLPARDRWIGWQHQPHRRRLDRLVRQARGARGGVPAKTPKTVYVYPLQRHWRAVLLGPTRPPRAPPPGAAPPLNSVRRPLCVSLCLPRLPGRSALASPHPAPTSHLHLTPTRNSSRPCY